MGIIAELATNVKQPLHWISMINDIVGDTYVECVLWNSRGRRRMYVGTAQRRLIIIGKQAPCLDKDRHCWL